MMRIIGGHDYYDSAAAYGVDPSVVFVRESSPITSEDLKSFYKERNLKQYVIGSVDDHGPYHKAKKGYVVGYGRISNTRLEITYPIVIFCGKIYVGVILTIGDTYDRVTGCLRHDRHVFWNADKFNTFLGERGWKIFKRKSYINKAYETLEPFSVTDITGDELTNLIEKKITIAFPSKAVSYNDRFYSRSTNKNSGWDANGTGLSDIEFQKMIDPVTAFQQISQWVGGTLVSHGPDIVEITDDNIKLAKHGMDKWSFRKHKLDNKS